MSWAIAIFAIIILFIFIGIFVYLAVNHVVSTSTLLVLVGVFFFILIIFGLVYAFYPSSKPTPTIIHTTQTPAPEPAPAPAPTNVIVTPSAPPTHSSEYHNHYESQVPGDIYHHIDDDHFYHDGHPVTHHDQPPEIHYHNYPPAPPQIVQVPIIPPVLEPRVTIQRPIVSGRQIRQVGPGIPSRMAPRIPVEHSSTTVSGGRQTFDPDPRSRTTYIPESHREISGYHSELGAVTGDLRRGPTAVTQNIDYGRHAVRVR